MSEVFNYMKYYLHLYGVCALLAVAAVFLTSLVKIAFVAILKRAGKKMPGTAKEYIFTPIAILTSASGVFLWLTKGLFLTDVEFIILCTGAFAVSTMFVYWLLFQPTRKLAVKLISIIAERVRLKELAQTFKEVADGKDIDQKDLQSIAKTDGEAPQTTADQAFHDAVNALKK